MEPCLADGAGGDPRGHGAGAAFRGRRLRARWRSGPRAAEEREYRTAERGGGETAKRPLP